MEAETFQCSICEKTVPVRNRSIHALYCERAASSRPVSSSPRPSTGIRAAETVPAAPPSTGGTMSETGIPSAAAAACVLETPVQDEPVAPPAPPSFRQSSAKPPAAQHPLPPPAPAQSPPAPSPCSTASPPADDSTRFLVECEYCDLPVPARSLDEHATQCGTRTDVCELCLNYVRLRDMRRHKESRCAEAGTGSAMRSALSDGFRNENRPLLPRERVRGRGRPQREEMGDWAPVAVAVGAVAAAAAVGMLVRRR